MSNITGSGDIGIHIRSLRDRAATARRLAQEIDNEEAARSLHKHADDLDQQAQDLENKISRH
jgi:predicted  nucleic acid-binding Zn-ribbon protein